MELHTSVYQKTYNVSLREDTLLFWSIHSSHDHCFSLSLSQLQSQFFLCLFLFVVIPILFLFYVYPLSQFRSYLHAEELISRGNKNRKGRLIDTCAKNEYVNIVTASTSSVRLLFHTVSVGQSRQQCLLFTNYYFRSVTKMRGVHIGGPRTWSREGAKGPSLPFCPQPQNSSSIA